MEEVDGGNMEELSLTKDLLHIPVEVVSRVEIISESLRKKDRNCRLFIKNHRMKLRNSRANFKVSWILEEELAKVIDTA